MRGAQHSAGTGAGEAWTGGQGDPCPVSVPAQGLWWSPSRGQLSLRSDGACPRSVAAAAEAAAPRVRPGWALPLLPVLCFLPVPLKKRRKRNLKKKGSNSGLFAKVQKSRGEGTPPRPGEKISSAFSDPAWPPSLPGPHLTQTLPRGDVPLPRGHRPPRGPSPRPPCWL